MHSIAGLDKSVQRRIRMERRILRKLLTVAIEYGFYVNIDNGEDCCDLSRNVNELMNYAMETDEEHIQICIPMSKDLPVKSEDKPSGYLVKGWFYFVYGNSGYDVICDYVDNHVCNMLMDEGGIEKLIDDMENKA